MNESDSNVFDREVRDKITLDKMIIKSDVETHSYTNKEEIQNGNIVEIRPVYSNFTVTDIPTANLSENDSEEEIAMRLNGELAMHLQIFGQDKFEDRVVKTEEFVRIPTTEPVKRIYVFSGNVEKQKAIVETFDEKTGEKKTEDVELDVPIFTVVSGEDIPVFEKVKIDRIERHFMDLSGEVKRINNNVMTRLGFTKARGMRGSAAIHEQHLKKTNVGTPMPESQEDITDLNIGRN